MGALERVFLFMFPLISLPSPRAACVLRASGVRVACLQRASNR